MGSITAGRSEAARAFVIESYEGAASVIRHYWAGLYSFDEMGERIMRLLALPLKWRFLRATRFRNESDLNDEVVNIVRKIMECPAGLVDSAEKGYRLCAYVNRMVKNASIDYFHAREAEVQLDEATLVFHEERSGNSARSPHENIEALILIDQLMARFSAIDRQIMTLYLDGRPACEIGRALSLSTERVYRRTARCISRMKAAVERNQR